MADFWDKNERGYEGPKVSANSHDRVQLGGIVLPGICKVQAAPQIQVDKQKVADFDGATLITRGYMPCPIDIECMVWTPEQWRELEAAIRVLWRKPNKLAGDTGHSKTRAQKAQAERELRNEAETAKTSAIDIVHPGTQLLGIRSLIIQGVSLPEPGPTAGTRVVHFKCIEYVASPPAPKKASRKVAGSKDGSTIHPAYAGLAPTKNAPPAPSKTDVASPTAKPPRATGNY